MWYNTKRIKQSLNYLTLKEYRQLLILVEIVGRKIFALPFGYSYFIINNIYYFSVETLSKDCQ